MAAQTSPISKSDFIRAQPATLSVAEVIAKGKAEGIKFGSSLVYMVRRSAKRKSKKAAARATKPTALPTPNAKPRLSRSAPAKAKSKADFVRARAHLSPKEIVEDATAEGVKFEANYVYRVRAIDKTARKAKRPATRTTASTIAAVKGAAPTAKLRATSSAEDLLRAVAAELGLGRAVDILAGERARVRAVIGG